MTNSLSRLWCTVSNQTTNCLLWNVYYDVMNHLGLLNQSMLCCAELHVHIVSIHCLIFWLVFYCVSTDNNSLTFHPLVFAVCVVWSKWWKWPASWMKYQPAMCNTYCSFPSKYDKDFVYTMFQEFIVILSKCNVRICVSGKKLTFYCLWHGGCELWNDIDNDTNRECKCLINFYNSVFMLI